MYQSAKRALCSLVFMAITAQSHAGPRLASLSESAGHALDKQMQTQRVALQQQLRDDLLQNATTAAQKQQEISATLAQHYALAMQQLAQVRGLGTTPLAD